MLPASVLRDHGHSKLRTTSLPCCGWPSRRRCGCRRCSRMAAGLVRSLSPSVVLVVDRRSPSLRDEQLLVEHRQGQHDTGADQHRQHDPPRRDAGRQQRNLLVVALHQRHGEHGRQQHDRLAQPVENLRHLEAVIRDDVLRGRRGSVAVVRESSRFVNRSTTTYRLSRLVRQTK